MSSSNKNNNKRKIDSLLGSNGGGNDSGGGGDVVAVGGGGGMNKKNGNTTTTTTMMMNSNNQNNHNKKKRPNNNNNSTAVAPPTTNKKMSNSNKKKNGTAAAAAAASVTPTTPASGGMDGLLMFHGGSLKMGKHASIRIIKGKNVYTNSKDPVDPKAPLCHFPLIGKFPESVVKPNFKSQPLRTSARLYQQDVPKPEEDSDDEDGGGGGGGGDGDNGDGGGTNSQQTAKKRWRYNRNQEQQANRQWILQEDVEFLETMVARRERRGAVSSTVDANGNAKISNRYEGIPEYNPSHYVLLSVTKKKKSDNSSNNNNNANNNNDDDRCISISLLPQQNATIAFAQPAARRTLSLSQAEQAIQDIRSGIRNTLRPATPPPEENDDDDRRDNAGGDGADGADNDGNEPTNVREAAVASVPVLRMPRKSPFFGMQNNSKNRLMNKLKMTAKANAANNDEEDGDDVMADVAYRNRKRAAGASRKELLMSLGDGVTVSDDGVLGGTNDQAFGGRGQKFGQLDNNNPKDAVGASKGADGEDGGGGAADNQAGGAAETETAGKDRGNDGLAMADDFYQRDVGAEYEELDYDANEQFDDDDVDLLEGEVRLDNAGGYAGAGDNEDDDDVDDDDDNDNEDISGAEGLASIAGFKAMLAKARGENVPGQNGEEDGEGGEGNVDGTNANNGGDNNADGIDGKTNDDGGNATGVGGGGSSSLSSSSSSPGGDNKKKDDSTNKRSLSPKPDANNNNAAHSSKDDNNKKKRGDLDDEEDTYYDPIASFMARQKDEEEAAKAAAAAAEAAKAAATDGSTTTKGSADNNNNNNTSEQTAHAAGAAAGTAAGTATTEGSAPAASSSSSSSVKQVDENGLRLITLDAVRREIWLNHGSIPMKRLMKTFEVKKKSTEERQNTFRIIIRELCTMQSDPISGRMLVLKQHYSNMS